MPGRADPIVLPDDSPALLLLRRIRDEAHRFALKHHRRRRRRRPAPTRCSSGCPASDRPASRPCSSTSGHPPACSRRALTSSSRCRPAAQDGARDPRFPEQDGRRRAVVTALCSVVYEAPGWGLGEVVFRDDVPVHHEHAARRRRRPPARRPTTPAQRSLIARLVARTSPGERPRRSPTSTSDRRWSGRCDAVRGAVPARAAADPVRRDDLLRRASRPAPGGSRPSRGRLGLRARYPLAGRAVPPRDPRRRQHRRVGSGGERYKLRLLRHEGLHL